MLVFALAVTVPVGRARAEPSTSEGGDGVCLAWDPGPNVDCPTGEQLASAVGDILGHPMVSEASCATRVTGAIRPKAGGGGRVELQFTNRQGKSLGERSFEIQDAACASLKDPLALVIALMVGGSGTENAATYPPQSKAARSAGTSSRDVTAATVAGAVSSGLLPDIGVGATLGLASRALAGLPLRLDATFWFPSERAVPGPDGRFWSIVGDVGLCPPLLQSQRVAVLGCLRVAAGAIGGVGRGLGQIEGATRPFGAGELTADLLARIATRISLHLTLGAAVPWLRPRFVYIDSDGTSVPIHQPSRLIPLASLGVDFEWGAVPLRGASQ